MLSIQNEIGIENVVSNAKVDFHSDRPQQNPNSEFSHKTRVDFLKLNSVRNNQNFFIREGSADSEKNDEGYERVNGAKLTYQMFLCS